MSSNLSNYLVAVFGLDHVMRGVAINQWDNPSPCSEWTARDVAGHAMAVLINVSARANGGDQVDVFDNPGAIAGADPYATFYDVRNNLLDALLVEGVTQRVVRTSLGEIPIDSMLGNLMPDALIHTWDIARATGGDERLDEQLIPIARQSLQQRGEEAIRAAGRYDAALGTASANPQAELLAYAGRRP
jgi:uncharacterized protein (TIGR03086 family)